MPVLDKLTMNRMSEASNLPDPPCLHKSPITGVVKNVDSLHHALSMVDVALSN